MKPRRIDFSPGDWIGGTLELSLEEEGLYIRICALIWSRGERITDDLLKASTTAHGNKINALLDSLHSKGKITRNGREIGQKRAENELENAWNRVRKASENGAKGGRPNGLAKAAGSAAVKATSTTTSTIKEEAPHTPRKRGACLDGFEEWWKVYPHKVGKGAAIRAWPRAVTSASPDELMAGVRRYIEEKPSDRPWANPATWLNQDRWLDEPSAVAERANGKPTLPGLVNGLASTPDATWRRRLSDYDRSKFWLPTWGFPPDDPDCYAPPCLLTEFGYAKR